MEWTKSILEQFIELYKLKPCLWDIKSEEYKNKNLKDTAFKEILSFLTTQGVPNVNIKGVKSKIQNMRRTIRKEKLKVEASKRSGSGADHVYAPNLWYYDLLGFLGDTDPVISVDNITSRVSVEIKSEDDCADDADPGSQQQESGQTQSHIFETNQRPSPTKKRKVGENMAILLKKCTDALDTNEKLDEYEAMGINFAAKFKKMDPNQQVYAELMFQKIIAKGLLGKLNDDTDVVDVKANKLLAVTESSVSSPPTPQQTFLEETTLEQLE